MQTNYDEQLQADYWDDDCGDELNMDNCLGWDASDWVGVEE